MIGAALDASALLALLRSEPGAERVRSRIAACAMSAVNVAEVVGYYARNGVPEEQVRRIIEPLPIQIVPFDQALAFDAGMLTPITRAAGLSLGDRACLSLARRLQVEALTADRAWLAVTASLSISISCIR